MKNTIFDFQDYKLYLQKQLVGKGQKGLFADHIGCQASFLSQVLRSKPDLSLEQGLRAADFFGYSESEARYFLLLLQHSRAGSHRLREYFKREMTAVLEERKSITKRVGSAKELSQDARSVYYSSWAYGAVHVLSSIEHDQQLDFFLEKTGLNRKQLHKVVEFLLSQGLLHSTKDGFRPGERRTHIPSQDPMVLGHHRNFRARVLEELKSPNEENLHYSLLMAISRPDGQKIKDMILQMIENIDRVICPSKEENAFQLCLDFFEI